MIANTYVVKPFGISEVKVIALKGDPGSPTQEQVNAAVEEYMDDHPEAQIPDGAVSTAKIADDAVTTDKIDDDAVTTDKVEDEAITTEKMASNTVAPYADNLVSSSYVSDSEPYLFRKTFAGVREDTEIVGGSVVWNQLCNSASVTIPNGRKYFMKKGTDYSIGASTGTAITGLTSGSDMVIDLTLMFGPTIADYIYTQEQATAGAGVELAKKWAGIKGYIPYDAGSLKSVSNVSAHKMVGFNQWDEEWEVGQYNPTTAEPKTATNDIRSKNYIPVLPNTSYNFRFRVSGVSGRLFFYDADKNFIDTDGGMNGTINVRTMGANVHFVKFHTSTGYGNTYTNDICINLSDPSRNGQYEPYKTWSYPLDSSLTLRGIPKLDGDSIYYDGDIYKADGTVERRWFLTDMGTQNWFYNANYNFFACNLSGKKAGTRNGILVGYEAAGWWSDWADKDKVWCGNANTTGFVVKDTAYTTVAEFKAHMSGVYLLTELAEPTTETTDPYTNPQKCYPDGTEEYIDTRDVPIPVGHNTKYMRDLKKLLEGIPDAPTTNGTYVLKATVSSSGVTYSWVEG